MDESIKGRETRPNKIHGTQNNSWNRILPEVNYWPFYDLSVNCHKNVITKLWIHSGTWISQRQKWNQVYFSLASFTWVTSDPQMITTWAWLIKRTTTRKGGKENVNRKSLSRNPLFRSSWTVWVFNICRTFWIWSTILTYCLITPFLVPNLKTIQFKGTYSLVIYNPNQLITFRFK